MSNVGLSGQVQNQATVTEHDGKTAAKRVTGWRYDAASDTSYRDYEGALTERYDYAGSPIIYVGTALAGADEGAATWTVTKYDLSDGSAASGKVALGLAWTSRASGSYS